ncbi:hypothetical protein K2173_005069 [Erythroxylum novogranatense]|uniref:Uncharacterized protein n=1 Tax=Erythroxylum novogranatense TaxID=1862640 RepID=A0AAV8TBE7_9ROSI|nr:hypothetical protein K2173_005069 [Erythroxylum novogranatense]
MNRSFRAQDWQMQMQAAVVKQRQQLRASMAKDKEEEPALFLEMKNREKEQSSLLLNNSEELDGPLGSKHGTSPIFNVASSVPARKTMADDFLNSDNDKNDYDWLLTPPGTPLFPSLEIESQKTAMSQIGTPNARETAIKSRLSNPQPEPTSKGNLLSKQSASSLGLTYSATGTRRPSSSGGTGSRSATPTGRPSLTSTSKPLRSSTPTRSTMQSSKPTVSGSKPTASSVRSTALTTKPTVPTRSSTPTSRPSIPSSKPPSRSATPPRRPSTLSSAPRVSVPPTKSSPSVTKIAPSTARNPVPFRAASPTVKSRPWKPSEMPGFALDTPPNLKTSAPERPLSTTRGRPGVPSCRSSSVEPALNGRPRRQSCSPARRRPSNGLVHLSGSSVPATNRTYSKVNDNVSPVVRGTKMVERVINMRKLAPPKQDDIHSPHGNLSGKSSSPDGFGRTLSKKSLDMAIRHMGIRQSIHGNLRPLVTNIPASSMYSVRSGPIRSKTISATDSPLATSSNASSEVSVNNNGRCLDGELEDEIGNDRGRSPLRGR